MTDVTWLLLIGCVLLQVNCAVRQAHKPHSSDTFDEISKTFWYEFSSPFTESYDEFTEAEPKTTADPLPFFEDHANSTNITTQFGSTVFLHCKVNDLRERTVSWVRRKEDELQLITFGLHTYSSDSRYTLDYQHPNDWRLQIQFANERDQGYYECQVSSHPPLVFYVLLNVVVPKVEIVDEQGEAIADKFYKAGSTIELKCVISQVPQPSSYVTWKHGQRMLNYDTSRGGISVKTNILPAGAMSHLYIANAHEADSGNYTCSLAEVASTTIAVHVLNGENPAAMQHGGCGKWTIRWGQWTVIQLSFTWLIQMLLMHRRDRIAIEKLSEVVDEMLCDSDCSELSWNEDSNDEIIYSDNVTVHATDGRNISNEKIVGTPCYIDTDFEVNLECNNFTHKNAAG
ncbi:hypothetical protein L9F63_021293 [Diploptera punctata]|uniref:Ig-like domain-containing protein n=1 Tax=Diploptera punctata TaxID=6984 RepID=A0AAD8EBW5_DIPPU|nr:hypothetical protein L9F63_021293 [Diploptera punctata]